MSIKPMALPERVSKAWMKYQPDATLLEIYNWLCELDRQKPLNAPRDGRIVRIRHVLEDRGIL